MIKADSKYVLNIILSNICLHGLKCCNKVEAFDL